MTDRHMSQSEKLTRSDLVDSQLKRIQLKKIKSVKSKLSWQSLAYHV